MIAGPGVNATDAGEVWHLLDQRFNIPATHLEPSVFNRIDLGKYNTIIMVGGNYGELNKDKLRAWVQNGGVLITTEEAVTWAAQNGISNVTLKKIKSPVDSSGRLILHGKGTGRWFTTNERSNFFCRAGSFASSCVWLSSTNCEFV